MGKGKALSTGTNAVIWFRRGLRLHDNPALLAAIQGSETVTPVYVINTKKHGTDKCGRARMKFILESLSALDEALKERNSSLVVLKGENENDVLLDSMKKWKTNRLCFEAAPEPHLKLEDGEIERVSSSRGINVEMYDSHLLWDHNTIEDLSEGRMVTQYQSFLKLLERAGKPDKPCDDAPSVLPRVCEEALQMNVGVPSLQSLGFKHDDDLGCNSIAVNPIPGGEKEALKRLKKELSREKYICEFEKPKTSPTALQPSTTLLSPYLALGCLSAKRFYHGVLDVYKKNNNKTSKPPTSLEGQLLWREFYYFNGRVVPNYDRMVGNPICKQIPWTKDAALLEAWRDGCTGYPWIDAAMTQLREQGWIHHLARHAVACFLTRGDFWVHWEMGRDVFEKLLVDADWSLNNGNWMWLSASAYFHQYFRVYGPVSFAKKWDPEGKYVKHFLPVLKNMPKKYIYEPWTAPPDVQRAAKCIIGVDYPAPIVDHTTTSKELIGRMADAYNSNKKMANKNVIIKSDMPKAKRART